MNLGIFILVLIAFVVIARLMGARDLGRVFASTTRVVGLLGLVVAVGLLATGRWAGALAAGAFAASLLGWDIRSVIAQSIFGMAAPKRPRRATWRTARLEVTLDGRALDGRVLAGRFAGRSLSSLSSDDLAALWRELAGDAESQSLAEAYLDRRMPGWRENLQGDAAAREARPARPGAMTDQEAYEILGLQPGAGLPEIMQAYRRLMKAVHPDTGGSAFLAAKVNAARDKLTAKHETRSN